MTTRAAVRLRSLERHRSAAGPCPVCPSPRTVYQDDDGRPCGRFGLSLQEDQDAVLPDPAPCSACGLPARVLVITYTRNWRGGHDTRLQWAGSPNSSTFRAARPEEAAPEGSGAWWLE